MKISTVKLLKCCYGRGRATAGVAAAAAAAWSERYSDRADRDLAKFKTGVPSLMLPCSGRQGELKTPGCRDEGMFSSRATANLQRKDLYEDSHYLFRIRAICLTLALP